MTALAAEHIRRWREHPAQFVRDVFKVTPDPVQEDVLEAFPTNQRIAMKASKGVGKLQPKSMVLDTPAGMRLWGELKAGDYVFAEDGSQTRIVATYDNGVVPLYRVTFNDGSSTLCGAEHLWKVRGANERARKYDKPYQRTSGSVRWVVLTTQEIINRGVRVKNGRWSGRQFEIPQHGPAQYPKAYQLLDPYVLGVWLGDGDKRGHKYTGIDKEVENEIVARGYKIGAETKNGQTRTIIGLVSQLRPLGVIGCGSHERFIPASYRHASIQQRMDLLSGLMDTDGFIASWGHMEFDTTSRQLADDVIWLARSLGGVAFLQKTVKKPFYYSKDRKKIAGRDCYRVTLRTHFNPFKITRKAERWKPADNKSKQRYLTRYIDRIDPVPAEDSMCIEVEHPSRCYLANDFIVTHNTTCEAWLAWNFLLTRPHPKIAATSISGDNLRDNLWTEMALWQNKSELLKAAFVWNKERIFSRDHPETWWMSARQWSKTADKNAQSNTLAGLHADYIMFILDESGGIPEAVMASAEAALSSCKEGHIVQAGNPTHLEGPLYRACTSERRLWYVVEVSGDPDDPKRSPRVSVQWAREQIEKYGRDNPWVLVNVFGKFPPASLNTLIGPDEVQAAMKRSYREAEYEQSARVLGVDVARMGDDSSVIFPRQGLQAFNPLQYRNIDGTVGAGLVVRKWVDWDADACFVDDTGGFGSSWIDNMRRLGKDPIGIHFSQTGSTRYYNKRAEMAFECTQWVKDGGAIPNIPELLAAMTQTTYTFQGDKLIIEPKDAIKVKLGYSPDHFDSLMLTFAHPVQRIERTPFAARGAGHSSRYDPLSREVIKADMDVSQHLSNYRYDPKS